jgi:hypothetical protein
MTRNIVAVSIASDAPRALMDPEPPNAASRQQVEIDGLRGQIYALHGVIGVLIANFAILARNPIAKREEILRSIESMLPAALAQMEQTATPATSAGFEQGIERVTRLARTAIRFHPATPPAGAPPSPGKPRTAA